MLDKHNVNVPLHVVRQKVEVTVGSDANLHSPHHSVQWDVGVDRNHLGSEPGQATVSTKLLRTNVDFLLFIIVCVRDAGSHPRHLLVRGLSPEPDVTAALQVPVEEHVAVADGNLVDNDEVQVNPI